MDQELKAKWVEALRSGKYQQCRKQYFDRKADAHCCLDVLAVVNQGEQARGTVTFHRNVEDKLPIDQLENLVDMNDGGKTFPEIADWIEQNL